MFTTAQQNRLKGKTRCGKKTTFCYNNSKDFEDPKFRKSMIFLNRGFRKTYVETLKLKINSLNHTAFDSKQFALSNAR